MKPYDQQNYYELLEVRDIASNDEIKAAYHRAIELFNPQSVALYGLADASAVDGLRARLLEAMEILTDPDLRQEYDLSIGIVRRPPSVDADEEPAQLAMSEILTAATSFHPTWPGKQLSYIAQPLANGWLNGQGAGQSFDSEVKPTEAGTGEGPANGKSQSHPQIAANTPLPSSATSAVEGKARPSDEAPSFGPGAASPGRPPVEAGDRNLSAAADISQEAAIATAEANMAQLAARAREVRPEPRIKPLELPAEVEFNGEVLRQCRESRGMGLGQLCERTRISGRHLENVEADRYDELPATVYLRGILVSVARELGLDPQRVSRSYLALVDAGKRK